METAEGVLILEQISHPQLLSDSDPIYLDSCLFPSLTLFQTTALSLFQATALSLFQTTALTRDLQTLLLFIGEGIATVSSDLSKHHLIKVGRILGI